MSELTVLRFDNQADVLPILHLLSYHRIDWQWISYPDEISLTGEYILPKILEPLIAHVSVRGELLNAITYDNFMERYGTSLFVDQFTISSVIHWMRKEIRRLT